MCPFCLALIMSDTPLRTFQRSALSNRIFPFALCALLFEVTPGLANTNIHTSWLWHLHQPIYWPDRKASGNDHYEAAWDTIQQQDLGRGHPTPEVLRNI